MINAKVNQIKINFNVTDQIKRFVYVYIIEAKYIYLIDSGVYGSEKQISDYLLQIGRNVSEIKGIFLTHAHPDHIGSASWFQNNCHCKVYASEGEKRWIENIDIQFKERPIPNFYKLTGKSCRVDFTVRDGDTIKLEEDVEIAVIKTAGHSMDDVSYLVEHNIFIGDAIPVKGDIPIFIDENEERKTLNILQEIKDINMYYPAWDTSYTYEVLKNKIQGAINLIDTLKECVSELDNGGELQILVENVCKKLQMPKLKTNPLFQRTISCLRSYRM